LHDKVAAFNSYYANADPSDEVNLQ